MSVRPMIAALCFLTVSCQAGTSEAENGLVLRGTVRAGAQLGEVKRHCAEGLYLVLGYPGRTSPSWRRSSLPDQRVSSLRSFKAARPEAPPRNNSDRP